MFLKLLLAFTVIPIAELYLLISVGTHIGAAATIGLVLLTGVVGASLARAQGLRVINEINLAASQGRVPGHEMIQGFIVFIGGVTLLTPGLITDLFGLSMLLPITRRFYAHKIEDYIKQKVDKGTWNAQYYHVGPPQ